MDLYSHIFANVIVTLHSANAHYHHIAVHLRHNRKPTRHARRRAHSLGLTIDIARAVKCPQYAVSIIPLPVLDTSPSPDLSEAPLLLVASPPHVQTRPVSYGFAENTRNHTVFRAGTALEWLQSAVPLSLLSPLRISPLFNDGCPMLYMSLSHARATCSQSVSAPGDDMEDGPSVTAQPKAKPSDIHPSGLSPLSDPEMFSSLTLRCTLPTSNRITIDVEPVSHLPLQRHLRRRWARCWERVTQNGCAQELWHGLEARPRSDSYAHVVHL